MVDEVLAETRRVQQRVRLLPARVVVHLVLVGCLFADLGYPQVWQQLTTGPGRADAGRTDLQRFTPGPARARTRTHARVVRPAPRPGSASSIE